jgi:hypothetical protein
MSIQVFTQRLPGTSGTTFGPISALAVSRPMKRAGSSPGRVRGRFANSKSRSQRRLGKSRTFAVRINGVTSSLSVPLGPQNGYH